MMRYSGTFLLGTALVVSAAFAQQDKPTTSNPSLTPEVSVPRSAEPTGTSVTSGTSVPGSDSPASVNATTENVAMEAAQPSPKKKAAAVVEEQSPEEPQTPKTEVLDTSATAGALATDGHDPILDPPPFPKGVTTLVGGVISSIDRIGNHLKVKVYGGGTWTIFFDERTHVFRNGAEATQLALKPGDRVYVDTMLDNNKRDVFARNIRMGMGVDAPPADTEGQIVAVDTGRKEVTLRDSINSVAAHFSVVADTKIVDGATPASFADLRPGSLVRVKFAPERSNRGQAREIEIVARPGASFTFIGAITFLDRHRGVLAVHNTADNKTYDLHIAAGLMDSTANLAVGSEVRLAAAFESTRYTVQQITVVRPAGDGAK